MRPPRRSAPASQPRCSASSVSRARSDRRAGRPSSCGLEREIALGVEAHRAVGRGWPSRRSAAGRRRSSACVDVDRGRRCALGRAATGYMMRSRSSRPTPRRRLCRTRRGRGPSPRSRGSPRRARATTMTTSGPSCSRQTRRERLGDRRHGEVLVLDVDAPARARPIARRYRASISRASRLPPKRGRVRAIADAARSRTRARRRRATATGAPSSPAAARRCSPVARCQRSRASSSSARAVSPSTISMQSWNGRARRPADLPGAARAGGARAGPSDRRSDRCRRRTRARPSITTSFS